MSKSIQVLAPEKDIEIIKLIVHKGSQVSYGKVLLLYTEADSNKELVERLMSSNCGIVKKLLHKEGDIVSKSSPLLEITECRHTTILMDLCCECGADLQQIDVAKSDKASVPMIHSVPELKVSEELARKLGRADTDRMLKDRKLALLVDLDQTLIHTTNDNVPNNLKDVYHFQLYGPNSAWYHTRLRPGTITFLKKIGHLYELHICTFGARNYAHAICGFLDENGQLFSHRILSRDECLNATSKKDNLKALFPDDCGDSMVCIIDDREDVWNHATNLIQVKPYHFFQHTGDINAPPNLAKRELDGEGVDFNKVLKLNKVIKIKEKSKSTDEIVIDENSTCEKKEEMEISDEEIKSDDKTEKMEEDQVKNEEEVEEEEEKPKDIVEIDDTNSKNSTAPADEDNLVEIQDPDDYLLYLETILMRIHERYYKQYDETKEIPDLKVLIPKFKSEVFADISIVFSGLVPNNVKIEYSRPYLIATNLGAKVTNSITEETTHLVAASTGTQKVFQAQKNKKIHIVTPEWLWTCSERWEHVEEKLFPLTANRSHKLRHVPAHCSPERIPEPSQAKFNNPYLQMSDDDIASMEAEVEDDSTDTDSDDEREDTPEAERVMRKRKRSQNEDTTTAVSAGTKIIETIDLSCGEVESKKSKDDENENENENEEGSENKSSGSSSSSDSETLSTKFRRGEKVSDIDNGSSESGNSEDEGDWNLMGAELEKGFLDDE